MPEPQDAQDARGGATDGTAPGGRGTAGLAAWNLLARNLAERDPGGSVFTARATGLLGGGFALLDADGAEFGRLVMGGLAGADLVLEGVAEGGIQRQGLYGARYRMTIGGAQVLLAGPERPPEPLRVFCAGRVYTVGTRRLPNRSIARPLGGEEAPGEVRLEGGVAGRRYRANLPPNDGRALAVAVFLLYRAVALRRQEH
jgi:hypothetical protein